MLNACLISCCVIGFSFKYYFLVKGDKFVMWPPCTLYTHFIQYCYNIVMKDIPCVIVLNITLTFFFLYYFYDYRFLDIIFGWDHPDSKWIIMHKGRVFSIRIMETIRESMKKNRIDIMKRKIQKLHLRWSIFLNNFRHLEYKLL